MIVEADIRAAVDALHRDADRLPAYLVQQRWFRAKDRRIETVRLFDYAPVPRSGRPMVLAIVQVDYADGPPDLYLVPLVIVPPSGQERSSPTLPLPTLEPRKAVDATADEAGCLALIDGIVNECQWTSERGLFTGRRTSAAAGLLDAPVRHARRLSGEQSNTSVVCDDRVMLKVLRKVEPGINPDREVLHFLTTHTDFRHVPVFLGAVEYEASSPDGTLLQASAALLQTFIPNRGDAWRYAVSEARQVQATLQEEPASPREVEAVVQRRSGPFIEQMQRLGSVTAALHRALGRETDDPAFRPEPVSRLDWQAWHDGMVDQIRAVLSQLRRGSAASGTRSADLRDVEEIQRRSLATCEGWTRFEAETLEKIRVHGDYHLGQVIRSETDQAWVILDFEGEPARPLAARRAKQCALKDVAGMLRSFDYAASTAYGPERREAREVRLAEAWVGLARRAFLDGYLEAAPVGQVSFLPADRARFTELLALFELDKAVYELGYELNNRPDWIGIPLDGIRRLLGLAGTPPS
ncbi:maltokinase N-terminal cap-like domain-containing protein [Candidatus Nitrospira bockiana]